MFAQCITAMAHHQYLELEGGHKLVEFIVRQCAVSDEEVGRVVKPSCTAMFNRPCKVDIHVPVLLLDASCNFEHCTK